MRGFNDRRTKNKQEDEDVGSGEEENYKHLTEKMSMIYTGTPRSLTIMDRLFGISSLKNDSTTLSYFPDLFQDLSVNFYFIVTFLYMFVHDSSLRKPEPSLGV